MCLSAHRAIPAVSPMSSSPTFDIEKKKEKYGANLKLRIVLVDNPKWRALE